MAASEEGRKVAGLAATAYDVALKDAKAAEECCCAAEDEMRTICDKQVS